MATADSEERGREKSSTKPVRPLVPTIEPGVRPKVGAGGTDTVNKAAPAQQWWYQNSFTTFDATDRWLAGDPDHGLEYQNFLYQADKQGWDENQTYIEAEKRGMFPWMSARMANAPGFVGDDSGSGSRGGGGGGGGGAPTPEQIAAAKASLQNITGMLGITMTDEQLTTMATTVVTDQWSEDMVYDSLVSALDWTKLGPGQLLAGRDNVVALASQYLMPISDHSASAYSARIASGEIDEAGLRSLFTAQAMKEYGWMGEALATGMTPRDFLLPARDRVAQVLELNPEDVDLMDPGVLKMLTVSDPATAATRAATLTEVEYSARKDSRWRSTKGAQDLAASAGVALDKFFGGRG